MIAPAGGTAGLGASERVIVNGTGGNLPALANGIVAPYIVAKDSDSNGSGDFLTLWPGRLCQDNLHQGQHDVHYIGRNHRGLRGQCGSDCSEQHDRPGRGRLKVGPVAVGGGSSSTLNVGPQSSGQAGVILNGGSINTSNLNFGSAEGLDLHQPGWGHDFLHNRGSGGLTTFGPGALTPTSPRRLHQCDQHQLGDARGGKHLRRRQRVRHRAAERNAADPRSVGYRRWRGRDHG